MKPIHPASAHSSTTASPPSSPRSAIDLTDELTRASIPLPAGRRAVFAAPGAECVRALLRAIESWQPASAAVFQVMATGCDRHAFHGALELMRHGLIDGPLNSESGDDEWMVRFISFASEPGPGAGLQSISLTERLRALADAGADVMDPNLLCAAASIAHPAPLRALLDLGPSIHTVNDEGFNALHLACCTNNLYAAHALIKHGADPDRHSSSQEAITPLMLAAASDSIALMSYLISAGASIHIGPDGRTPLHEAALMERTAAVEFLLSKGANAEATCALGRTPLHDIADSCLTDPAEIIAALLRAGADINAADHDGATTLHLAADFGTIHAVTALLHTPGIDVDARQSEGCTALHLAASQGREAIVSELLQAGASLRARNKHGQTPIDVASSTLREAMQATQAPAHSSTDKP